MEKFSFKNTNVESIKKYFIEVHSSKYDYSLFKEYENSEALINIGCTKHGIFKQSCYSHSKGHGCRKCATEFTASEKYSENKDKFYLNIKVKFDNKISVTGEYINNSNRIKYKCNNCLIEYQNTPNKLLSKNNVGCAYCYGNGKNKQTIEYFEKYKELLVKEVGFLYIVRLYNKKENFIKIGITKEKSCEGRFNKIPYTKEILYLQENNMYNCFKIEQYILKNFKPLKYTPLNWFGGVTECLEKDCFKEIEIEVRLLMAETLGQI